MSYPILWTEKASDEYIEILKFLDAQYGVNAAMKIYEEVERICDLIAVFPELYQTLDDRPDLRRAVILIRQAMAEQSDSIGKQSAEKRLSQTVLAAFLLDVFASS